MTLGGFLLLLSATLVVGGGNDGAPLCSSTIDSDDPVHGLVRSGADLSCEPVSSLIGCIARCCDNTACTAFSFNGPWVMPGRYMGCIAGEDCCCLKASAPDSTLAPNKYPQNITTGETNITIICALEDTDRHHQVVFESACGRFFGLKYLGSNVYVL